MNVLTKLLKRTSGDHHRNLDKDNETFRSHNAVPSTPTVITVNFALHQFFLFVQLIYLLISMRK